MKDTPTPRTDAESQVAHIYAEDDCVVTSNFARQLERELARVIERLQPDPGGSDKIDELESSMGLLRQELAESHAREEQLREALETCQYQDWGSYDTYGKACGTFWFNSKKVKSALSLPPPPVIPKDELRAKLAAAEEDAERLAKALKRYEEHLRIRVAGSITDTTLMALAAHEALNQTKTNAKPIN